MGIRQSTIENAVNFGNYMLANNLSVLQATDPEREQRPRCVYVSEGMGFLLHADFKVREYQLGLNNELVRVGCLRGSVLYEK